MSDPVNITFRSSLEFPERASPTVAVLRVADIGGVGLDVGRLNRPQLEDIVRQGAEVLGWRVQTWPDLFDRPEIREAAYELWDALRTYSAARKHLGVEMTTGAGALRQIAEWARGFAGPPDLAGRAAALPAPEDWPGPAHGQQWPSAPEDREFLAEVAEELRTQDRSGTPDPIFLVQHEEKTYGIDASHTDPDGWELMVDGDSCGIYTALADAKLAKEAIENYDSVVCEVVPYVHREVFLEGSACLTRSAAEAQLHAHGADLINPRVYMAGLHRNYGMRRLTQILATYPANAPVAKGVDAFAAQDADTCGACPAVDHGAGRSASDVCERIARFGR